jgi:hypothetical protein
LYGLKKGKEIAEEKISKKIRTEQERVKVNRNKKHDLTNTRTIHCVIILTQCH